jgi:prepilin-type processing-associated H-X9-DG protein
MKLFRNARGFTATELLFVAALVSSIPAANYIGVHNKAMEIQCRTQLRQIAMAVEMFVQDNGRYPDALFYPEEPLKDERSIVLLLGSYGAARPLFLCPVSPQVLRKKGLSYLWNDELSGRPPGSVKNPGEVWLMVDVTSAHEGISSHSGGYNYIFADGTVRWKKEAPVFRAEKE